MLFRQPELVPGGRSWRQRATMQRLLPEVIGQGAERPLRVTTPRFSSRTLGVPLGIPTMVAKSTAVPGPPTNLPIVTCSSDTRSLPTLRRFTTGVSLEVKIGDPWPCDRQPAGARTPPGTDQGCSRRWGRRSAPPIPPRSSGRHPRSRLDRPYRQRAAAWSRSLLPAHYRDEHRLAVLRQRVVKKRQVCP